jgi:hypothetical protein
MKARSPGAEGASLSRDTRGRDHAGGDADRGRPWHCPRGAHGQCHSIPRRRFLISLQLGSIYLTRPGQFAARPAACLAQGCPPKVRRWVFSKAPRKRLVNYRLALHGYPPGAAPDLTCSRSGASATAHQAARLAQGCAPNPPANHASDGDDGHGKRAWARV